MIVNMRLGAVFPQTEIGTDPAAIRHWAQAVEGMGYQHVVAFDHILGAGADTRPGWQGFTTEHTFHECSASEFRGLSRRWRVISVKIAVVGSTRPKMSVSFPR